MLPEQPRRNTLTDPPKIDFEDPIIDSFFFDTWGAIAKKNTKIYEEVSFLFIYLILTGCQCFLSWSPFVFCFLGISCLPN